MINPMTSPKPAPEPQETERAPRGARRKRDTRARLLKAALQLMAHKGVDGVAINEITEQADVGFGTFYNHFPSKEAIYEALIEEVVDQFAAALDRLGELVPDPAEKVAASVRYTLQRGRQDPIWGRFVVRTGFASEGISHGLGKYLIRDLGTGLAMKRFKSDDLPMTFLAVGSTVLGALAAEVEMQGPTHERRETLALLLQESGQIPERIAVVLLTMLGLDPAEAKEIANRPLPTVSLPANPLADV